MHEAYFLSANTDPLDQIEGLSKRNSMICFQIISFRQNIFSTLQNCHKWTSKPYFGVLSEPIAIKNLSQSNAALRIA